MGREEELENALQEHGGKINPGGGGGGVKSKGVNRINMESKKVVGVGESEAKKIGSLNQIKRVNSNCRSMIILAN